MTLFEHANKLREMLNSNPRGRVFKLTAEQVRDMEREMCRVAYELMEWHELAKRKLDEAQARRASLPT